MQIAVSEALLISLRSPLIMHSSPWLLNQRPQNVEHDAMARVSMRYGNLKRIG